MSQFSCLTHFLSDHWYSRVFCSTFLKFSGRKALWSSEHFESHGLVLTARDFLLRASSNATLTPLTNPVASCICLVRSAPELQPKDEESARDTGRPAVPCATQWTPPACRGMSVDARGCPRPTPDGIDLHLYHFDFLLTTRLWSYPLATFARPVAFNNICFPDLLCPHLLIV